MSPQRTRGKARWAACLLAGAAASTLITAMLSAQDIDSGVFDDEEQQASNDEDEDTDQEETDEEFDEQADEDFDEEDNPFDQQTDDSSQEPTDEDISSNPDDNMSIDPGDVSSNEQDGEDDESDDEDPSNASAEPPPRGEYPDLCSDNGPALYEGDCRTLKDGFAEHYKPKYQLWADNEKKDRFIHLVGNVNASNPDRWEFETGTILYKTFLSEDRSRRYETRIIKKEANNGDNADWSFKTWGWDAADRTPTLVSAGQLDWDGTGHNIPSEAQCGSCHRQYLGRGTDPILGFSAIQLNHDGVVIDDNGGLDDNDAAGQLTLSKLGGRVTGGGDLGATATIPGDDTAQQALGYLHANCGHCHGGSSPAMGLGLWSMVGTTDIKQTPAWQTAICKEVGFFSPPADEAARLTQLLAIGEQANDSLIIWRMQQRDGGWVLATRGSTKQMPPLATQFVHDKGFDWVLDWASSITSCE